VQLRGNIAKFRDYFDTFIPGDLITEVGRVNIISHYIGFCLGFLSSYVFFIWKAGEV